jgi:hypothetical protein
LDADTSSSVELTRDDELAFDPANKDDETNQTREAPTSPTFARSDAAVRRAAAAASSRASPRTLIR